LQEEGKTETKRPKKTQQSGFWAAKLALRRFGTNVIDGRTSVGRVLEEMREALVRDLGGPEAISRQQQVLVDLALRTHLLLESLDAFIFSMHSPVNKRKRQLYPVVRERQALADSLARYMSQLGLEKRKPPEKDLRAYLAERSTAPAEEFADACKKPEEEHEEEGQPE
jgi:hypothetical protein